MVDIKITIAKTLINKDLIEKYHKKAEEGLVKCSRFKAGDVFISPRGSMPEGFCSWAWADIQRDVAILLLDGNFSWIKEKGVGITCCSDGFTPVIFKLERI